MKAVLLVDMGSPTSEKEMKIFLKKMFLDKSILPLSKLMRMLLSFIISNSRYKNSWSKYELIGGSPLKENDFYLAKCLSDELENEYLLKVAFSYTEPLIADVIKSIYKKGIRELHVVPLYPQFSYTTTGSVLRDIDDVRIKYKDLKIRFAESFYKKQSYIDYWKELIMQTIQKHELFKAKDEGSLMLVFSAHSIPEYNIQKGDSYVKEINETAKLISDGLDVEYKVGFQSKIGRVKWVEPDTKVLLKSNQQSAISSQQTILMVPISFLSENLETKYDLDHDIIPYAKEELGIENVYRVEIPKSHPLIVKTIKEIILS